MRIAAERPSRRLETASAERSDCEIQKDISPTELTKWASYLGAGRGDSEIGRQN